MSFIPDDHGEAVLRFDYTGGPSNPLNVVLGYNWTPANSPLFDAEAFLLHGRNLIQTASAFANNIALLEAHIFRNPGGQTAAAFGNFVGAAGEVALPPQVAILVRKNTARGGRRGRGRIYWPGMTVSGYVEGGVMTSGAQGLFQGAFETFRTALAADGCILVVLHDVAAGGPPDVVTGLSVQATLATQRRRIRG